MNAQTYRPIETVDVEPTPDGEAAVVELDSGVVRIVADRVDLDGSDNLTFYRENRSVAHAKVLGVPLEVPNLVRRAVKHGERGSWS